jgi:hypothetical protein
MVGSWRQLDNGNEIARDWLADQCYSRTTLWTEKRMDNYLPTCLPACLYLPIYLQICVLLFELC